MTCMRLRRIISQHVRRSASFCFTHVASRMVVIGLNGTPQISLSLAIRFVATVLLVLHEGL